jgi:dienelactone hydrolase/pimeloyl-ACP methyl ester carboxylesterase
VDCVSSFDKEGYRIENVLFDSFPGWQVNATVYVPLNGMPPFQTVVVPVGHSGKQFESYQLPCQFFARAGYAAITFDPPGQAGEKQPGNDHFVDGVRCYLVGETSSQYFVADALRCIDYLQTRHDVDTSRGVAMTGVSGGGTTTMLAGLMDDRVKLMGPSCCVSPLAELPITRCYGNCPETLMWRRYADGIDEVDLLCAAAPKAILLMAGEEDEVFRIEDTRRVAEEVRAFYGHARAEDRFEFFTDAGGHGYSLDQARRFALFMNRWLRGEPDHPLPDGADESFSLNPYEEIRCYPRTDVNMRSLAVDRAEELERTRELTSGAVRRAAMDMAGVKACVPAPEAEVREPSRVWTHYWQEIMLRPEEGIELPATLIYDARKLPAASLLHFDDGGRHRRVTQDGPLARAIGFLRDEEAGFNLFAVDLRGWGDTAMAPCPYDLAAWAGVDRFAAYISAALGDHVMSMRIRDGLAALAYLRTRQESQDQTIVVSGCGLGGIVALHVAAIDENIGGVVVWETLLSFRSLLAAQQYPWPADTFLPNVLLHYDLPELCASIPCPVRLFNPLDGSGARLPDRTLEALQERYGSGAQLSNADWASAVAQLRELLGNPCV